MREDQRSEPTEDELVAFAASLLSGFARTLEDRELLRETVREARELWIQLYQVAAEFGE